MTPRFTTCTRLAAAVPLGKLVVFILLIFVAVDSAHAIDLTVGPKEVIYTKAQRRSKKLRTWPDGNLGVVANGSGGYDFYGANGKKRVKTTGTLEAPAMSKKSVKINNLPRNTFNYVSGGPIYQDSASGARLMVYHAEKHSGSSRNFHSVLGLAISTDVNGLAFRNLGTIVEPNLPSGFAEVGGGTFAVFDDYFHVYYRDWYAGGGTAELAVARAPLADLISNALSGQGTAFSKYYNGSWSQPGLGGLASPLEIGNPSNAWTTVSYNDYLDQLVMVSSQWTATQPDLYLATSPDGINWSPRQPVVTDVGEQFYPTLIGTGPDPTHTDQAFYVYYTDSQKGAWSRWSDAQLVRRAITLAPITSPILASPDESTTQLATSTAVPEPSTAVLVLIALAGYWLKRPTRAR